MGTILSVKNDEYFDGEFPLFFKQKDGKSAIDVCISHNQIRSVNMIIHYITKYQNSYVFSHLFEHNLIEMIFKGADLTELLNSEIFNYTFDFDDWPSTHPNTEKMSHPYNGSFFRLNYAYPNVFKNIFDQDMRISDEKKANMRPFKIFYQLNLLPAMSEEDGQLMEALSLSDEVTMFDCDVVKDLIEYRWNKFAFRYHFKGALAHLIKLIALILYINYIYLTHRDKMKNKDGSYNTGYYVSYKENALPDDYWMYYLGTIFFVMFYPAWHDLQQISAIGPIKFCHVGINVLNVFALGTGFYSCYLQIFDGP